MIKLACRDEGLLHYIDKYRLMTKELIPIPDEERESWPLCRADAIPCFAITSTIADFDEDGKASSLFHLHSARFILSTATHEQCFP